uniref:Peptidase_M13 domain-containing protein n=1 Tax=Panagrellus redivivus TaxID=6233 RepID=A0A7E4W3V8_PANRE
MLAWWLGCFDWEEVDIFQVGTLSANNGKLMIKRMIKRSKAWCTNSKKEEADPNDPHPYALTRVKMTSTNIEEFSEAFKCPKKSTMNPDERCSIW